MSSVFVTVVMEKLNPPYALPLSGAMIHSEPSYIVSSPNITVPQVPLPLPLPMLSRALVPFVAVTLVTPGVMVSYTEIG